MEKKLKFSDFAALVGVTPKTVYKMESRNEIKTVTEKVNNRETRLVVTTDEQIEEIRNNYRKEQVNNSNCNDILTNNNNSMNNNEGSENKNNILSASEMFEKMLQLNEEYMNRLYKVNEELTNSKAQVLFLEDKAGREGLYLKEINELKTENEGLKKKHRLSFTVMITAIIVLLLVLTCLSTVIITSNNSEDSISNQPEQKVEIPAQQNVKNVKK